MKSRVLHHLCVGQRLAAFGLAALCAAWLAPPCARAEIFDPTSTPSPSPTPTPVWDPHTDIGITPGAGDISDELDSIPQGHWFPASTEITLSCERADDVDRRTAREGVSEQWDAITDDPDYPWWFVSKGEFKDGDCHGISVKWITPDEGDFDIEIELVDNDLPRPIPSDEAGSRDDAPRIVATKTVNVLSVTAPEIDLIAVGSTCTLGATVKPEVPATFEWSCGAGNGQVAFVVNGQTQYTATGTTVTIIGVNASAEPVGQGAWVKVKAIYEDAAPEATTTFTVCLAALSLDKSDLSPVGPPANTAVLSVGVEPDDPSQTAVLTWCVDPARVCVYENGTTVSSPIQRAPGAMPAQLSVTALQGLSTGPCEIAFSLGYLCASDKAGAGVRYWTPPPDATNRDVLFEGVPVTNMTIYNAFTPACNDLADYGYSARMHGDLDTMWAYAWSDAAQSGGYGFLNYTSDLTWNRQLEHTDVLTTGVYAPTAQYQDVLQGFEAVDDGGAVTEKTATAKIFDVTIEPPLPFVAVNTTHTLAAMVRPPLGGPDGQLYIWTRGTNPDCLRFVVGGQEYDDITTSGETMASVTVVTKAPGLASLTIEYRSPYDDLDRRITYTTSTQIGVVLVEVTHIKFNHDPASTASDAINIRQDYSNAYDITNGEWIKGGANLPACYTTSKTVSIKARFSVNLNGVTSADLSADSTDYHGTLGDVSKTNVSFTAGVSDWVTMPVSGLTAACVKKTSDTWQWKAGNFNGLGAMTAKANASGPHTTYVILSDPVAPWSNADGCTTNAWVTVLNIVCQDSPWAGGTASIPGAAAAITDCIYSSGRFEYDSAAGDCFYTIITPQNTIDYFDMSKWTQRIDGGGGRGALVNCWDCANGVVSMSNILGCDLWNQWMGSATGFECNEIRAIKDDAWARPFGWGFGYHRVGWRGGVSDSGKVFDACLKVDSDGDPTGSGNHNSEWIPTDIVFWTTGGTYDDYKQLLVAPSGYGNCIVSNTPGGMQNPGQRRDPIR